MGRIAIPTLATLATICCASLILPSASALYPAMNAAQTMDLFTRDSSSCTVSGYQPCDSDGLPSDFCCPSTSKCMSLNNATSAICCPTGSTCQQIQPITCDITQLNVTLHPQNPLHSTDLSGSLLSCGSNTCCPQGYACQNDNACVLNNQTLSSSASSDTSSATASPTSTDTPNITTTVPTTTASISASNQSSIPETHSSSRFPATAIIAGFFPGLVAGALLAILIIMCCGRRRSRKARKSNDFGHVSATVSDPIYQPQNAYRTDFLRRQSKSRTPDRTSRVRSLFSRTPSIMQRNKEVGYVSRRSPRTPEMRKEPSMESIKIYSPPSGTSGALRQTTFTDMMADAGYPLSERQQYMGTSGKVDPKSRGAVGIGTL